MSNYGKCASCSKWVPKGDATCPHCGAEQTASAALIGLLKPFLPQSEEPRRSGRLCVVCNKLVGIEDTECPHCGARQTGARKAARALEGVLPTNITATQAILGVLGVLFVLPMLPGAGHGDFSIGRYLGSGDPISNLVLGSLHSVFVSEFDQWWRVITAGFLHFGAMHVLFNGYALTILGPMTERLYGRGWFVFIYVLTGIAAFVASYYGHPQGIHSAGASGSIFGLIGLGIGFCLRNRLANQAMLRTLVMWTALSVVVGLALPVDNWAHGGGFVAGFGCAWALPPERVARGRNWNRLGSLLGGIAALVVLSAFALVIDAREETAAIIRAAGG